MLKRPYPAIVLCLACSAFLSGSLPASTPKSGSETEHSRAENRADLKPLGAGDYDAWNSVSQPVLSRDGDWLAVDISPEEGDGRTEITHLVDGSKITVPRGARFQFSKDNGFAIGRIAPPFADLKAARRKKAKPEDLPKPALAIVNLKTGKILEIDKLDAIVIPKEDSGWIAYTLEAPKKKTPDGSKPPEAKPTEPPPGGKQKKTGQPLVLHNLTTGKEESISNVTQYALAKNGTSIVYAIGTEDGKGDRTVFQDLIKPAKITLETTSGEVPQVAISEDGRLCAYEIQPAPEKPKKPKEDKSEDNPEPEIAPQLFLFRQGDKSPKQEGLDSIPKGWQIDPHSTISFSESGSRLLYDTYPKPRDPKKELPDDEKVNVDIWNWKDAKLMPEQILQADAERKRGYRAILNTRTEKSMQVADKQYPEIEISDKNDGQFALATTTLPYDREASWHPGFEDVCLIDLNTLRRNVIATHFEGTVQFSPKGRSIAIFDDKSLSWTALDAQTQRRVEITKGIGANLSDELNDVPDVGRPYGIEGWATESAPIVADRYDLWLCDATGLKPPLRLTRGREVRTEFRAIKLDPDTQYVDLDGLVLTALDDNSKDSGFYELLHGSPTRMLMEGKRFSRLVKAKDANRVAYAREEFTECPNVWVSDLSFAKRAQVTDANPQQKDFLWGTAELVHWTSLDGVPLSGILVKPANFDYGKQYPMITYFYERYSDDLHSYHIPAPSASTVNLSYLASNGYCVFVPDIPYRIGYPGYSALSAIVPGVQSIVSRGYIDPKRLGIQGQSWGGYQVAYLVTQTKMFAAAEAGAPVGDMFSAYGGIRYGAGIVREFQYEHSQSRIGGTPWDSTLRYLENSPVFFADKVETPLMIMSNDQDGAVPHTQGIELFTALRRLDKPCWMVVYNGEDHNIMQRKNRKDFSLRLYQFFDHFLKGAPEPEWMSKGVPAVDKGLDMGLGLPSTP